MKPRHAIAFHFFNEEGTRYGVFKGVREVYDGPLSLATDLMVWNIIRDGVTERMAVVTEEVLAGSFDVSDVEKRMVGDFMKKYTFSLGRSSEGHELSKLD